MDEGYIKYLIQNIEYHKERLDQENKSKWEEILYNYLHYKTYNQE